MESQGSGVSWLLEIGDPGSAWAGAGVPSKSAGICNGSMPSDRCDQRHLVALPVVFQLRNDCWRSKRAMPY